MTSFDRKPNITIVGGGPAGLMAAEQLAKSGCNVTVYERKKSLGRKFLMAGRGGLNLTHSESQEQFLKKYGKAQEIAQEWLFAFSQSDLREWAEGLGETTFVGSSGRIFPKSFKASPLLRAWISHLEELGVKFKMQHQWIGWDEDNSALFTNPNQTIEAVKSEALLLALGGASWPNLGSDGSWVNILQKKNIEVETLQPANCGFNVAWSPVFQEKFSGQPIKNIALHFQDKIIPGEIMIDQKGIEGGAIYAVSSTLRDALYKSSSATLHLDLRTNLTHEALLQKLSSPKKRQSFSSWLQKTLNLSSVSIGLLREADMNVPDYSIDKLAKLIKAVPIKILSPFPIEHSISSSGGISLDSFDDNLMLKNLPGVFVAGEMLDWEAPTGGYLLQACFSSGHACAKGILNYLRKS